MGKPIHSPLTGTLWLTILDVQNLASVCRFRFSSIALKRAFFMKTDCAR